MGFFKKGMIGIDWVIAYLMFIGGFVFIYSYVYSNFGAYKSVDVDEVYDINYGFMNESMERYKEVDFKVEGIGKKYLFRLYENYDYGNESYLFSDMDVGVDYFGKYFVFQDYVDGWKEYRYLYSEREVEYNKSYLNVSKEGNNISNGFIFVGFGSSGVDYLRKDGYEYLNGGLSYGSLNGVFNYSVVGVGNFSDGVVFVPYNNTGVYFYSDIKKNVSVRLREVFDKYYNGSEEVFNNSGLQFSGSVSYLDVYNSDKGILFVGDFENVEVYNETGYKVVFLNNTKYFEVFLHNGSYVNALDEIYGYGNGTNISRGVVSEKSYFNEDLLLSFENEDYEDFKDRYSVGYDFNISFYSGVLNMSYGKKVPKWVDVYSYAFKSYILKDGKKYECWYSIKVW